jgi:galactose-1-phosphate uridylyltransferase
MAFHMHSAETRSASYGRGGTVEQDCLLVEYRDSSSPVELNGERKIPSYSTRIDPLSGSVSRISIERADGVRGRNTGLDVGALDVKPVNNCLFCNYRTRGARPLIEHNDGTVSMKNPFPWEGEMWVSAYPPFDPENGGHKLLLSEVLYTDVERLIRSEKEIAQIFYRSYRDRPDVVLSFRDFTNWGPYAGASQQHPHSQRALTTHVLPPVEREEFARAKTFYETTGTNLYDAVIGAEVDGGERVVYRNDRVCISSPFAPRCNDEIIIVPTDPVTHVLQMDEDYMRSIIRPVLGVFPGLFFYRGVRDLNIIVHMAPFSEIDDAQCFYRWHMHIIPRKSGLPVSLAGAELGYGDNVIGVYPEHTAGILREWYAPDGPNSDAVPVALKDHFHNHINNSAE